MLVIRKRWIYLSLVIVVVILGLSTRQFAIYLPRWVNLYLGDCLWALMIFLLVGLIYKSKDTKWVAVVALLICYFTEVSQLYHSPWIDALRNSRLGGLVLGRGFLWSDLVSYSLGIGFGTLFEKLIHSDHWDQG
jgi:hypothetical protein